MSCIKLIVGLCNPGIRYAETRHNVGAKYLHVLAERNFRSFEEKNCFFSYTASLKLSGRTVRLLLPTTFMNSSGKAVKSIATFYDILPEEILVAHDELDFPPGVVKFKQGGGSAGHNGVKDVINRLGVNKFYRLRIGIGHPGFSDQVIKFVLTSPSFDEKKLINCAIDRAIQCTELWIKEGKLKAIERLNSFK